MSNQQPPAQTLVHAGLIPDNAATTCTNVIAPPQSRRPIPFTLYREHMEHGEHREDRRTWSTEIFL